MIMLFFQTVTTVEFSSSTLSVWESSGSLVVPLVLSGQTQSQSFSVIVIAEANSSLSPAAAGNDAMFVVKYNKMHTPFDI